MSRPNLWADPKMSSNDLLTAPLCCCHIGGEARRPLLIDVCCDDAFARHSHLSNHAGKPQISAAAKATCRSPKAGVRYFLSLPGSHLHQQAPPTLERKKVYFY